MVKQVFEYLAEKLAALQMFEQVIPIAEIIDKADGSFPAYYVGKGNYRPIDLSAHAGVGYFRKLAAAQFAKSDRETFVGSETLEEVTLPIRLVLSIKKDILNIDTGFASSYLFEEMIRVFSGNHPILADKAGVTDVEVFMKDSEDDRLKIFANEYTGSTLRELPYDWIMVMVDMDVKLLFNKNCINKFCDGYSYDDCPPVIIPTPEPCPDCPECPVLDPMTIEGVRCDFNTIFQNDFPADCYISRIRFEGGEVTPTDSFPATITDEGWWVSARNMLQAEGINFDPGVISVSDLGDGQYLIGIGQCDTKMLDITLSKHSDNSEIITAPFEQMYCAAYCAPCPECPHELEDVVVNSSIEEGTWTEDAEGYYYEGSDEAPLKLDQSVTDNDEWYLIEFDVLILGITNPESGGFRIDFYNGDAIETYYEARVYKFMKQFHNPGHIITITPLFANQTMTIKKSSIKIRHLLP